MEPMDVELAKSLDWTAGSTGFVSGTLEGAFCEPGRGGGVRRGGRGRASEGESGEGKRQSTHLILRNPKS